MKSTSRDGVLRGGRAAVIRLLILAAGGISAYLLSVSMSGGRAIGCGPGSGCDEVLGSRWAYVLGVPVSALALVVYLALLVTSFSCGPKSTPKQRRGAWEIMVPGAVLIFGGALWFTALQAFVLHRFCPWCLTAHACGAAAAILLLTRVPLTDSAERRDKDPAVPRSSAWKAAIVAIVAVAVLGVAQVAVAPKTYSVTSVPAESVNVVANNVEANSAPPKVLVTNPAAVSKLPIIMTNPPAKVAAALAAAEGRAMSLLGGRFQLDITQAPIWGATNAPHKMVSLFDYTCYHCRDMHSVVADVFHKFSNQLAIVSLPMPLDSRCNYLMRITPKAHTNACTYAKLGLIVWRAKHEAVLAYDDWFFGFKDPPSLQDVTNKAVELVSREGFAAASRDPWVEMQLGRNIDLYVMNAREFKNGQMPQFFIGTNVATGTLTTDQLRAVVEKSVPMRSGN
jgi:uncharacterized membrane protein